jgi:hypothetical protein
MRQLAPYSAEIGGLVNPVTGMPCCNWSDCRTPASDDIQPRQGADGDWHWFVRITHTIFAETVNNPTGSVFPEGQWLQVPTNAVLGIEYRSQFKGLPIVCWSEVKWYMDRTQMPGAPEPSYGFYCFVPPSGV